MKNLSIYIKRNLHNFNKWLMVRENKITLFTVCIWAVVIFMAIVILYMG